MNAFKFGIEHPLVRSNALIFWRYNQVNDIGQLSLLQHCVVKNVFTPLLVVV